MLGKFQYSNTYLFMVKYKPLIKNIAKKRNGDEKSMKQAFEQEVLEKICIIFGRDIVERRFWILPVW